MRAPALLCGLLLIAMAAGATKCPVVSSVKTSEGGAITGGTLWKPDAQIGKYGELYPKAIVLVRGGEFYREIVHPAPFYWRWIFWNDGRQIVADTSRVHGPERISLFDVDTGMERETVTLGMGGGGYPAWAGALIATEGQNPRSRKPPVPWTRSCRFQEPELPQQP